MSGNTLWSWWRSYEDNTLGISEWKDGKAETDLQVSDQKEAESRWHHKAFNHQLVIFF
jgi:hypothetical protein